MRKVLPAVALLAGTVSLLAGCMTIQAIEPVVAPPPGFVGDVSVEIEFQHPALVGARCAERGAKFLGFPGINSSACADAKLITMIDPCSTLTAGQYAKGLCLARSRPPAGLHPVPQTVALRTDIRLENRPSEQVVVRQFDRRTAQTAETDHGLWRIEFVGPAKLSSRCSKRKLDVIEPDTGAAYCAADGIITMPNPCKTATPGWYERTLCHELGHVNGWPADHSTPVFDKLPLARNSPAALALVPQTFAQ